MNIARNLCLSILFVLLCATGAVATSWEAATPELPETITLITPNAPSTLESWEAATPTNMPELVFNPETVPETQSMSEEPFTGIEVFLSLYQDEGFIPLGETGEAGVYFFEATGITLEIEYNSSEAQMRWPFGARTGTDIPVDVLVRWQGDAKMLEIRSMDGEIITFTTNRIPTVINDGNVAHYIF